jgi:hypothetical protein
MKLKAAKRAGILLPVTLELRSVVEAKWGTPAWDELIKDIAVQDLEYSEVKENVPAPGLDERVNLSRDIE